MSTRKGACLENTILTLDFIVFSRRAHLVAEAIKNKQTSFDLIQEGNYLPLSDYMVLAIKMVEAILSNSTFTENSKNFKYFVEYRVCRGTCPFICHVRTKT